MSVRKVLAIVITVSIFLLLAACGGSSSPKAIAPPSGAFSNSNLNGTYVLSTSGADVNNALITLTGAITANGSGGITGGAFDYVTNDSSIGTGTNQAVISGSSYYVGADGRGQIKIANSTGLGTILLNFVLSSNSHGLITEYDANGSGSGTIDLQSTIAQSQLAGNYAFALSGAGATASFSTAGAITLDATGNVTAGTLDFNNGSAASTNQTINTGSFISLGTGTSPGTAQLSSVFGVLTLDVYAVDATHLKLVETDGQFVTSGDAFTQGTSLPISSTLAFTVSGADLSSTPATPLALGGLIPLDASGNVSAGATEDFNDNGNVGQDTAFTGGFSALTSGRTVLTLNSFVNGAANLVPGSYSFAAYPFTSNGVSGMFLLEIDGLGISTGAAYVQTGTSVPSQGNGFNLSAFNTGSGSGGFEEDDIAEFATTSTGFTGILDINDQGSQSFDKAFTGTYATGGTGRYAATANLLNFNFYSVNNSTFLVLETDSTQIGTGIFEAQSGSGSAGAIPGITKVLPTSALHAVAHHR